MVIIREDAYAAAAGVNVRMVRRGDVVLASIRRVHDKRQEGLRKKPLTDIVRHRSNLTLSGNRTQHPLVPLERIGAAKPHQNRSRVS